MYILLDFLRLQGRYERVCWKLKPVVWAHEILVRDQQNGVARMWRRSLTERVGPEADRYIGLLERLQEKYSVRMSSIERRLMERFGHPMQIDRLRALVTPAMQNPSVRKCRRTFELLQHETQAFSKSAFGAGLDLPSWLVALENEVESYLLPDRKKTHRFHLDLADSIEISIADLRQQLEQMPKRRRDRLPHKDES